MPLNNTADIGQPNAGALEFMGAVEPLKDAKELIDILHIEADAVIANEDHCFAAPGGSTADFDFGLGATAGEL